MSEHATVEKVVDGVAIVTVRIPVEMVDDVIAMADHIIHACRWLRMRSKGAPRFKGVPSRFLKVNG